MTFDELDLGTYLDRLHACRRCPDVHSPPVVGAVAEMGSGFVVSQTLVPKWFVRRRGRALGIATMGTG
ncbi:MAG: hypothetical protein IIA41_13150, partial [SAR324 cluster bacterium]|nr:hypothetical protein [SAR324 cluster bacterium]